MVRELFADQPVERAATLEDVRADVIAPTRLNTMVIGGFAVVALAIALVGIAGVLAFSVSGRTREFGIRMAIGSRPADVLRGVLGEGALIAIARHRRWRHCRRRAHREWSARSSVPPTPAIRSRLSWRRCCCR